MKLINWIARYHPKQLVDLDPALRFPDFLSEQDIKQIIESGNSIFWEKNPPDISIFDYACLDLLGGLSYSNKKINPKFITFHYASLPEDRLKEIKKQNPNKVMLDFLYVAMRID